MDDQASEDWPVIPPVSQVNGTISFSDDGEGFASAEDELRLTKRKLEELSISHYEEAAVLKKEIEDLQQKLKEAKLNSDSKDILYRDLERRHSEYQDELQGDRRLVTDLQNENGKLKIRLSQLDLQLSEKSEEGSVFSEEVEKLRESLKLAESGAVDLENALRSGNDKLFQCQSDKEALQDTVNDLKEQLNLKDKALEGLKKDVESESNDVKNMSDSLRERRREITELRGKVSELESQNRNLTIEDTELRHTNNFLKKDLETCKAEKLSAVQRLHEVEESQRSNEGTIRHEMDVLSKAENRMRQRCIEMEAILSDLMKEKDDLELQNSAYESRVKALELRLVEVQDEKTDVEFQINGICSVLRKTFSFHIGNPLGIYQNSPAKENGDQSDDFLEDKEEDISTGLPFDPDELANALSSWKRELSSLQSQRDELKELLEAQRQKYTNAEGDIASLKKNLEDEKEKTDVNERAKCRIEQQFVRTEETLRLQEEEISRKDGEISNLVEENSKLQKQISLADIELKDIKQRAVEVDSKSEIATRDKFTLQRELTLIESRYHKLEKSKRKMEIEYKKQQAMSNDTLLENETLRTHLEALIDDNRSLAEKAISYEKMHANSMRENAVTSKNTEEQIREITRLRKELKAVDKMMRHKDSSLRSSNDLVKDLRAKLEDIETNVKTIKASNKSLEDELQRTRRDETMFSDQAKTSQNSLVTMERRLKDAEDELRHTTKAFKDQGKTVEELLSRITTLQNEKDFLRDDLNNVKQEVMEKEQKIKTMRDSGKKDVGEIEQLQAQVSRKQRECDKLQASLINITEEKLFLDRSMRQLEDEKEVMKSQLQNVNIKMAEMASQYEKKFIQETQKNIHDLQREKENLQSHIEDLEEERNFSEKSQSQRISSLEAQISSLRLELKKEIYRREQLEEMYMKKDNEMGRFRSTFDQSLNTITKDTKNLKVILDKSLHKIDKQILVGQGLASDTDLTSDADEPVRDNHRNFSSLVPERLAKSTEVKRTRHRTSYSPDSNIESIAKRNGKYVADLSSKNSSGRSSYSPSKGGLPPTYKSPNRHRNIAQNGIY